MAAALAGVYQSVAEAAGGASTAALSRLMTLLIISPDYASHLFPLATLAHGLAGRGRARRRRQRTGHGRHRRGFGFERVNLQLGRGSNPGTIRAEDQPTGEDDALRGFFDATRGGRRDPRFQAEARSRRPALEPGRRGPRGAADRRRVQPDQVIVDHLAFSARLALISAGVRHADVVLGHPSALPVGDEVYGYPGAWPAAFTPDPHELVRCGCSASGCATTSPLQWNDALLRWTRPPRRARDAFTETGDVLLLNYPAELHAPERTALLPEHAFLGSAVRSEADDPQVTRWLAEADARPIVYVSFGSFLSVRGDVLARVAEALRGLDVRVAIAVGSTDAAEPRADPRLLAGARRSCPR